MSNHEFQIEIIVTIISVIATFFVGYILAIITERRKKNKEEKAVISALIMELKYIRDIIKEQKTVLRFKDEHSKKYDLHVSLIDVPILDAIIFSGMYPTLSLEIQKSLSNLRGTVYQGNQLLLKLIDMRYTSINSSLTREEIQDYGDIVNKHIDHIKNIIEGLLPLLTPKK